MKDIKPLPTIIKPLVILTSSNIKNKNLHEILYSSNERKNKIKIARRDDEFPLSLSLSFSDVISHLQSKRAKTFAFPSENGGRKGGSKFP